ncbi:MAG: UDP-N-acetylmuramate dehydrogenase [Candidatus Babeliales bacterium]
MQIQKNIPLSDKNWFKTGGNANFFCQPTTESEFQQALKFADSNNLNILTLGLGANILISDSGFNGLVINPKLNKIFIENNMITAQSGAFIQDLINFCLDNNFADLEEFSLIPGTVGGSVYINIHYINHKLSDFLVKAKIINKKTGETLSVSKDWFDFGYDKSKLQEKEYFLIDATFKLKKVDAIQTAYAKGRRDEIIRHRKNRYPYSNTCGSFFRNFYPEEINFEINGKKITAVAYYLDKIGIKGELRVGNAIVSSQHANMIVTLPGAKSCDVLNLAKKMQQLVFDKFGVKPVSECQIIGERL